MHTSHTETTESQCVQSHCHEPHCHRVERTDGRTDERTNTGRWRVRCARLVDRPEEALEVGAQVARELARDDELAQPAPGVITRGGPYGTVRYARGGYALPSTYNPCEPWGQAALRLWYVLYAAGGYAQPVRALRRRRG